MKLPSLFLRTHQRELESCFFKHGPIFRIIPREPLGTATVDPLPDETVTVVTVRGINERGSIRFEAFSKADLTVATEWARRHRNTPPADFTWLPPFSHD